ncbi:MAG TPA: hypothetical protein VK573_05465 [Gemmatimonadales bacterium]|nr:hypothetical protein [Gemmatimonadales bacterium]
MKRLVIVIALAPWGTPSLVAQQWTPEIGITGGFARLKPAGSGAGDNVDLWEVPGSGTSYQTVFMIIPLGHKVALEPGLTAFRGSFKETNNLIPYSSNSNVRLTLRANFALTNALYAAAGGYVRYREIGFHQTQVGTVAAIGYRERLGSALGLRLEGQWIAQRGTDSLRPSNVFAVLLGFSRTLSGAGPPMESKNRRPAGSWRLGIGIAGGYVRNHLFGGAFGLFVDAKETIVDLPGSGRTTPPSLYAIIPLTGKLALETGFDAQRIQEDGTTRFDAQLAPRFDFAVYRGIYAAAGGNLHYFKQSGSKGFAFSGASFATGYRFPLMPELEGRVEMSYTTFKQRQNFPFAQNSLGILFGMTVALR